MSHEQFKFGVVMNRQDGDVATCSKIPQKSLFTSGRTYFNPNAPPFISQKRIQQQKSEHAIRVVDQNSQNIIYTCIGPTQLPVNSRIWNSIAVRPSKSLDEVGMRAQTCTQSPYTFGGNTIPTVHPCSDIDSSRQFGPIALMNGTIQIRLREGIKVDMTIDKSVRVINPNAKVFAAISGSSSSAALCHPNGKVFQHGPLVDLCAYDAMKRNNYVRFAKMWEKGISLTSEGCVLIYLVDSAGTRTCSDTISFDMTRDYTIPVFLDGSHQGAHYLNEAIAVVQESEFWINDDSSETFNINGWNVTQAIDGLVRVSSVNSKCVIRTSPTNGSATVTTPFVHCTASLGKTSHLFARSNEKRMHFDGTTFVVRNAGYSAGFDEVNRLRVY